MPSSASTEKEFIFTFTSKNLKSTLCTPVPIPLEESTKSFAGRLISAHNIPCYVHEELTRTLGDFIRIETRKHEDSQAEAGLEALRNCTQSQVDDLVKRWTKKYTQNVKKYAPPEPKNEEITFYGIYHDLIHSPAMDTVLNLEHTYADNMQDVSRAMDQEIAHVEKKQQAEMDRVVQGVGIQYTSDYVNNLAQKHFEKQQEVEKKWENELKDLQETQKGEFRGWVINVHEDINKQTNGISNAFMKQPERHVSTDATSDSIAEHFPEQRLEESFTIHLGAQMKSMHNLRILCADVLDLCKHKPSKIGGLPALQPQRLQTAMSLFSNNLCGVVMLVDNRLNYYTGLKRDFFQVCQQSTDFHFPDLEAQFARIEKDVLKATELRLQQKADDAMSCDQEAGSDRASMKSGSSGNSTESDKSSTKLQTGDFYITRHSNLAEVHTVFHLVSDENIRTGDISSRHPIILGLRNVLKVCFKHDITTLTVPLLLTHEMTEEMTIPWCIKRAELVFKCMKGFMIEMATWGGKESTTLQFLVPKTISDDMFLTLRNMLPQIFRLNNPLVIKS